MPNKTIRNLNTADQLNGGDFLVIAQTDGSTKKIPVSRFSSEMGVVTDSNGRAVTTNRFKIPVGIDSHVKGLDGVERSASNSHSDKAFMLVTPQSGTDEESVRQTDFCYFCAENQPVTCLILNRPFVSLDEAMVWARYNIPAGADVQFEMWGNTCALHLADSLGQFSTGITSQMKYNSLILVPKMRWIGVYNSSTGFWDPNPYIGRRWIADFNRGPITFLPPDMSTAWKYYGVSLIFTNHANYKTRGGDGSGMVLNSLGTSRGFKNYLTGMTRNSNFWDYGNRDHQPADSDGSSNGDLGQPLNAEVMHIPDDINIHVGGAGAALRFWFRYIPQIYIVGMNFCDYAFGGQLANQRFFRISNGICHVLGEPNPNYDGAQYIFANERGPGFYTKHSTSHIFETTESGMVYIMTNIRQYTVGATRSGYDNLVADRATLHSKGLNLQDEDYRGNDLHFGGQTLGVGVDASGNSYAGWVPAIAQSISIGKCGIGGSGANTQSYVIFDPLGSGWRRFMGQLCLDNGDLKYTNGEKMLGWARSNIYDTTNGYGGNDQAFPMNFPNSGDAIKNHLFRGDEQLIAYDPPDNDTLGFFDLPAIDWGETHTTDGRYLPDGGPFGWLMGNNQSQGMAPVSTDISSLTASVASMIFPQYYSWGNTDITPYYTNVYSFYHGKVKPDNNSFIWNYAAGSHHAPCCTWQIAKINDNGHYVQMTPGVNTGPGQSRALTNDNTMYYGNSGDRVYSNRGYRHFYIGRQNQYNDDYPNNHTPTDPNNWKYLNAGGGTDFLQGYTTGVSCRLGASIWFSAESAFNFSTDNGSIFMHKYYNVNDYHGHSAVYKTPALGGFTYASPIFSGYGSDKTIMSTSMHSGKSSELSWFHPSKYGRNLTLPTKSGGTHSGVLSDHPDGFFGSPGGQIRSGVNFLPMIEASFDNITDATAGAVDDNAFPAKSWGGFWFNPHDMFKYYLGRGSHISEQHFIETPNGSSITIGGGAKEDHSSYPGLLKERVNLAKALGNNRLIFHPLSNAMYIDSNGNPAEGSWWSSNTTDGNSHGLPADRDGAAPRSSFTLVGSHPVGTKPYNIVFNLEAYREIQNCPPNFAVRSSDGARNNPYHGTSYIRDIFGINGSHPSAGAQVNQFPGTAQ